MVVEINQSNSSEFEGEEKKILLQSGMHERKEGRHLGLSTKKERRYQTSEFHLVDLKHEEFSYGTLPPLLNCCAVGSLVALDDTVYLIGGLTKYSVNHADFQLLQSMSPKSNQKFYFGGSRLSLCSDPSERSWSPAPAPFKNPVIPNCTSLHGKIYAFGTTFLTPEVFDPTIDDWMPFLPLPPELRGCCVSKPVLPDPSNNRIIMCLSQGALVSPAPLPSSLYAFIPPDHIAADVDGIHCTAGRWECLNRKFRGWTDPATLLDGVIYFHSHRFPSLLQAYDVSNGEWLKVSWVSQSQDSVDLNDTRMHCEALFPLGDKILCLAKWRNYHGCDHMRPSCHAKVDFIKFGVKRSGATLSLVLLSNQSYHLPATYEVLNILPV